MQPLYALGRNAAATPYATLLALFNLLIARFSNQYDFCIGTSVLGRPQQELMEMQGFFVNNLILRTPFTPQTTFRQLLADTRQTTLDALSHQDYPFDRLLAELQVERNMSRNPLAQIRFAMNSTDSVKPKTIGPLHIQRVNRLKERARYDLHLRINERGENAQAIFSYNTDVFAPDLIEQMALSFRHLLGAVIAEPDKPISHFSLQSADAEKRMILGWNQTEKPFPLHRSFPALFAEMAEENGEQMAAEDPSGKSSWRELRDWTDTLAGALVANGVQAGQAVALLCHRDRRFLAGLLAILQIGAVYLPLDPRNPLSRHQQMMAHSGSRHLLASNDFAAEAQALSHQSQIQVSYLDLLLATDTSGPYSSPTIHPTDIAYLLYTSGSTGMPKGALVEHRGMLNHLYAKITDLGLTSADRIAQTAPQSFDISAWFKQVGSHRYK